MSTIPVVKLKKPIVIGFLVCTVILSGSVAATSVASAAEVNDVSRSANQSPQADSVTTASKLSDVEYELTASRLEENSSQVRFTITITNTEEIDRSQSSSEITIRLGAQGVPYADSTDGFEESEARRGTYTWDGTTEDPSLSVTTSAVGSNSKLANDDAVIVETPDIEVSAQGERAVFGSDSSAAISGPDGEPAGITTSRWTAVGDVSLDTIERNGTQFGFVMVGDASADTTRMASMLGRSQQYLAGQPPENLSIIMLGPSFSATSAFGHRALAVDDSLILVSDDVSTSGAVNTLLHEYVHTQQSLSLTRESNWWIEAIAEYQTARVSPAVTGTSPAESFDHLVSDAYGTAPLREPDHPSVESSYERGSYLLLSLSIQISQATDGTKSVQDVIAKLYEGGTDGPNDITRIIEEESNEDVAAWFERYAASSRLPEKPTWHEYEQLSSRPPDMTPTPTPTATPESETTTAATAPPADSPTQTDVSQPGFTLVSGVLAVLTAVVIMFRRQYER